MEIVYSFDLLILMVTLTSVTLQVYLFFTVIFKSPTNMSQYRYFLCLFTFWDCFYNITVGLILCPEILLPAPAALMHGFAMELIELFGHGFNKILGSMILWGGADVIQLQTYCLMYRFCAIHPNPNLLKMFMSWPGLIVFHILGYAIAFSVTVPAYICVLDEEKANYLIATLPPESLVNKGPRTPIIFFDMHCPVLYEGCIYIFVLFFVSIVLGFFMAIHIIVYLRKHASSFTKKTYKMHLQLTVILIVQQITPILFLIFPIVAIAFIALHSDGSINISKAAFNTGVIIMTLYPATNALICIIFITPYWNFTKQWVSWILYKLRIIKKQWGDDQRTVVMLSNISSMTYAG